MSTWFSDDANSQLLVEAKQIAWEFLDRSGEIDDARLALSNRAIAAFREYRRARTIELTLVSR